MAQDKYAKLRRSKLDREMIQRLTYTVNRIGVILSHETTDLRTNSAGIRHNKNLLEQYLSLCEQIRNEVKDEWNGS